MLRNNKTLRWVVGGAILLLVLVLAGPSNTFLSKSAAASVAATTGVTLDLAITSGSDDAWQNIPDGSMAVTGGGLLYRNDPGVSRHPAMRWVSDNFPPQGSTITAAYVTIRNAQGITSGIEGANLHFQNSASPPAFSGGAFNITSRPKTVGVFWNLFPFSGNSDAQSPSLVAPLQQIVDNFDPTALVLLIVPDNSKSGSAGQIRAFEGNPGSARLHIEWNNDPPPTVTSVAPNEGPIGANTPVTLTGTDFLTGATVTFGGAAATTVSVDDSNTITAVAPVGAAAVPVDIVVTNPDGRSGTLVAGFTYRLPPTATSVVSDVGPTAGTTPVTITGTDFVSGATVTFGGAAATQVLVDNSTTITALTPASAGGGPVDVVVTNPDTQSGTLVDGFTYADITGTAKVLVELIDPNEVKVILDELLKEATVELLQGGSVVDSAVTDTNGVYRFPEGLASVSPGTYTIRVNLRHDDPATSTPILRVNHGGDSFDDPAPDDFPVPVAAETASVTFTSSATTLADITFGNLNGSPLTADPSIPVARLDDLAAIYAHTMQALTFGRDILGVTHDLVLPIEVFAFRDTPVGIPVFYLTQTGGGDVHLAPVSSDMFLASNPPDPDDGPNPNRAMNREWHEMFHELMDDAPGVPPLPSGDQSHFGFANSKTTDSWREGWAEYWPLKLKEHLLDEGLIEIDPDPDPQNRVFPKSAAEVYEWEGLDVNMEDNHRVTQDQYGSLAEEFSVASLLWDLTDPVDQSEGDRVQVNLADLFGVIGETLFSDMLEVYDALVDRFVDNGPVLQSDLDLIFINHGFFTDNGNNVFEPNFPESEVVGPAANTVPLQLSFLTDPIPARPGRTNVPLIERANVLVSTVDQLGQPVQAGSVVAFVEYADFPQRNFQDSFDLAAFPSGLLPIYPPPEHITATVTLQFVTPDGEVSDTLVILNDEYAEAFAETTVDFVGLHQFDLGQPGVTTVLTYNQPPVADAGQDQTIQFAGQQVTLDGSGSDDPDGDELTFSWALTSGPAATIADPSAEVTAFTPTDLGASTFTLTVTDPSGASDSDTVVFTVDEVEVLVEKDSFLRNGARNRNEGANPLLSVKASGKHRSLVSFDLSSISPTSVTSATLEITISDNANNWGQTGGRPVDAHPLLVDFAEGDGMAMFLPNAEKTRGNGLGVTWKCAIDTEIANQNADCDPKWNGGDFGPATSPPVVHFNGLTGTVSWDVTQDLLAGSNAWLIKKREEGPSGHSKYLSSEGAEDAGDPSTGPRLILQ